MVHIGGIILYQGNNKPWHVGFTIVIYTTVLLRQRHTILKGYNSSKISIIWCLPAMTNELNTKYKKVEIYDLMFNNSFQLKILQWWKSIAIVHLNAHTAVTELGHVRNTTLSLVGWSWFQGSILQNLYSIWQLLSHNPSNIHRLLVRE